LKPAFGLLLSKVKLTSRFTCLELIMADAEKAKVEADIKAQGDLVRKLKTEKAPKEKVK